MAPLWRWSFQPLRVGSAIYNDQRNEVGSIGGFARDAAGDAWLLSCGHVLAASDESPVAGSIVAPDGRVLASASSLRIDAGLDAAAARLNAGVTWTQAVVGLGMPGTKPIDPVVGMQVCKVGAETTLTEGTVVQVGAAEFIIEPSAGFPADYELSARGDSGALWLEISSRQPVGLHRRGSTGQGNFAAAIPIKAALVALSLSW